MLPAGQDARGPHVLAHVLGIVEGHDPAASRVPYVVVEDVIVLVPLLAGTARLVQVAVPVGMHKVSGSEQTGQRALHGGLIEDPPDLGNPGQDIVSRVAFFLEHGLDFFVQVAVELRGKTGIHLDVPVRDEAAYIFDRK